MKLLSLVVPTRNDAKYLPSCLESISCQLSNDVELIIVDDGSSDDTPVICKNFSDAFESVQVIRHGECRGASAARNSGLSKSCGRYVVFVDSDDCLSPDAVANLLQAIIDYPLAEVVVGQWIGESNTANNREMFLGQETQSVNGVEFLAHLNNVDYLPDVCWHYAIQRRFLVKNNLTFIDAKVGEDQVFVAQVLCLASEITLVPKVIYWHRTKSGGLKSSKDVETTLGYVEIVESLTEMLDMPELSEPSRAFLSRRISNARGALGTRLLLLDRAGLQAFSDRVGSVDRLKNVILTCQQKFATQLEDNMLVVISFCDQMRKKVIASLPRNKNRLIYLFCSGIYALAAKKVCEENGYKVGAIVDNNEFAPKESYFPSRLISPLMLFEEVAKTKVAASVVVCNPRQQTYRSIRDQLLNGDARLESIEHLVF
tara:strand:- start:300 stop:1583 length:1284 start_codon:yes stop_codon:yes gene_type:complete